MQVLSFGEIQEIQLESFPAAHENGPGLACEMRSVVARASIETNSLTVRKKTPWILASSSRPVPL